jgi:hypothetical protein
MKRSLFLFTFIVYLTTIVFAQTDKQGAIKTHDGFIIYFSHDKNSYTLNLKGSVNLSNHPFIKLDDKWFEMNTNYKAEFGNETDNVLINYMNWELDHLKTQFKKEIKSKNKFVTQSKILVNFWQYDLPILPKVKDVTPVKTIFFADFSHNDLVYRFSYASTSGSEIEAKQFLLSLVDNIRFYKSSINLARLQNEIFQGKNYYNE